MEALKMEYDTLKSLKDTCVTVEDTKAYYIKLLALVKLLGYKEEGYKVCEEIVLCEAYDFNFKNAVLFTQGRFISPLPTKYNYKISCPTAYPYIISSPSLVKNDTGYICNMRAINYHYNKEDGNYTSRDSDGVVRTKNYMMQLSNNFLLSSMWELEEAEGFEIFPCHIMGMEDVRLFGSKYFFCTRLDANLNHNPVVCFGIYETPNTTSTIDNNTDNNTNNVDNNVDGNIVDGSNNCVSKVIHMNILGDGKKTEKNWLPMYSNKNGLEMCHIIYSFEPLIIYHLDLTSGEITKIYKQKLSDNNLSTFRGSAVPIQYKKGWLCTVHQVYYHQQRKYFHRFVWISKDYKTVKYSRNFYFHAFGVEFNLGIAHHDDGLLVTYSINDANPQIGIVDYDYLDDLLQI